MLGLLRTTLAVMVMVFHLFANISPIGTYSVYGFYVISGYLMTLIMHESYGYTWVGRLSFAINRVLRLYPQYWIAALFSVVLIHWLGEATTRQFHESIFLPNTLKAYVTNFVMLFPAWYPNTVDPRLVPPTWALTVEIFFYMGICLGLSKTRKRVVVWLLASLSYVIATFVFSMPPADRYFPVTAASLPFAMGAGIYFLTKSDWFYECFLKSRLSARGLFILMLTNCLIWTVLTEMEAGILVEIGFYLNLGICGLLVYSLSKGGKIINISRPIDSFIGDFSYPVYLLHWQAGLLVSFLIYGEVFHEFSRRGAISSLVALLLVSILSLLFIYLIDHPIQSLRMKIKANKALRKTLN